MILSQSVLSRLLGAMGLGTNQASGYIDTPQATTYTLVAKSSYRVTLQTLLGVKTSAGTLTAAVQINGVAVTGLSAVSVTTVAQDVAATAANVVAIGDRVTLVVTSPSSAAGLEFTLKGSRL